MVRVVVLVGPPGSGKSSIGEELARRGLRYRDWEAHLVERWGSREAFVAHKDVALPALHADIVQWIDEGPPAAVIESTGLSDAQLIDALDGAGDAVIVRVDVSEATALERVAARPQGRHLTDDLEQNRRVWREFHEHVRPTRRVDLVIDSGNCSVAAAASAVCAAVAAGG